MTKLPFEYRGYTVADSDGRGGKAGRGCNRTATVQVRESIDDRNYLLKAQFRYTADDRTKRETAISKATAWVDNRILELTAKNRKTKKCEMNTT